MNVRLVLERKRKRIWTARLRGTEATIGRALGSTVRIPSSEVSRLHCRLRVENGIVTVEDLESVNGTFLNDVRVRGTEMVCPGDRLAVGPITLVVEYELTPDVLDRLRNQQNVPVLEAADDEVEEVEDVEVVEAVEVAPAEPPAAVAEEVLPLAESLEDEDMVIFDDAEEMHLPEGGDLREFLLELDDDTTEKRRS